ncbi:transcriptional regulator, XRE family [Desulfofarcimen acetoxidans DSM 771]|uniref:Transcriptional regulator, XRE family n=1 Tax=Desulfofarcimen acetoxidans (strain ATCC 49208 / DSM 771 / KCTC 5769 / VKM B-1644 / 5575) TaxID=485916 RepID=C8VY63_DESAS|nr:helix-turn-helix transcriptional regulator [Desulfofarcimen acetoxidans]ACV64692.1 transcriptional regulator, XRE family [Desulfofarcimen acetoxidans DSM 771]
MFTIRKLRIKYGVTQEKLAQKVGISRIYLSELENGRKKNPSTTLLEKIAKNFDVRVSELYE